MSEPRPELQPKSLSPEHFRELNKIPKNKAADRCKELRDQYRNDPLALWQLDRFDPSSEFAKKIDKANEAYIKGDMGEVAELKEWFNDHRKKFGLEPIP